MKSRLSLKVHLLLLVKEPAPSQGYWRTISRDLDGAACPLSDKRCASSVPINESIVRSGPCCRLVVLRPLKTKVMIVGRHAYPSYLSSYPGAVSLRWDCVCGLLRVQIQEQDAHMGWLEYVIMLMFDDLEYLGQTSRTVQPCHVSGYLLKNTSVDK